ncbi:minor capsid protein [Anaerotignum sp.]|uniref:minor capsid protein n=1 Tax=Anaerotignum sp. TaxID=2039241 RepID=UPI002714934A|nr:minor capsid protein [Anaerotignum sp.]
MKYEVKLDSPSKIAKRHGLGKGGVIQKYIDSRVITLSAPYTPFQTGTLTRSATLGTVIGSGEVTYNAPYARYLYYGKVMVSPTTGSAWAKKGERKVVTAELIKYNGAPRRGAYWFSKMKKNHGKSLLREVRAFGKLNG